MERHTKDAIDPPRRTLALRTHAPRRDRGLWRRVSGLFARASSRGPSSPGHLDSRALRRAQRWARTCFAVDATEAGASAAVRDLMRAYTHAGPAARSAMLVAIADASEASRLAPAEAQHARRRALQWFYALPEGPRFLLGLRADLLSLTPRTAGIQQLESELTGLLAAWFEVGHLELRRLSWDSPASLLEKLIRYEAVHAITSWGDLRNRLDPDRECYALFHPRLPDEPLIFVEVAFAERLADNIGDLLDQGAPLADQRTARWAIFYSISNTQAGLRGISFGRFLLQRVMAELETHQPRLRGFATLSPIPGMRRWLEHQSAADLQRRIGATRARRWLAVEPGTEPVDGRALAGAIAQGAASGAASGTLRELALGLCAQYLIERSGAGVVQDPVARFHLGNGARIERINWGADLSDKGLHDSLGLMVNYRYVLADVDRNLIDLAAGRPRSSRAVRRLP